MQRSPRSGAGFTLTELMVAVVIIGVLSAIATVGYRRYIGKARLTEAYAMLGEISSKEQTYRIGFYQYLPMRNDGTEEDGDESGAAFYPASPEDTDIRTRWDVSAVADRPASWRALGIQPPGQTLYCTYMANAGDALDDAGSPDPFDPPGTSYADALFEGGQASSAWFYALAACNISGSGAYTGNRTSGDEVSIFGISSHRANIQQFNENK